MFVSKNKKRIKILQVIGSLDVGGAETMLLNILKTANKNKFEFYFLCYSNRKYGYEDDIKQMGGKIIRIKKAWPIRFIREIIKTIRENEIDVVHCHTYYNSVYPVIAARISGIKTIISHSHNTRSSKTVPIFKKIYYKVAGKFIKKYSTHLVACGNEAGKAFFGKNSNFSVFNNGIILDDFAFSLNKRNSMRKELGISEDTVVVGHIGRFSEQKNHEFLVKVFYEYQKNNQNSVLLLLGDGGLIEKIKKMVDDKGISDKVMFLGVKKNAKDYYSAFDVFAFPSWYEGLPVVLVEAQANGVEILASDTIDKGVDVCGQMKFLPIDSIEKWVVAISNIKRKRYKNFEKMLNGKYDLSKNIKYIESIYEGGITNKTKGRKV